MAQQMEPVSGALLNTLWKAAAESDDPADIAALADALDDADEKELSRAVKYMIAEGKRPQVIGGIPVSYYWDGAAYLDNMSTKWKLLPGMMDAQEKVPFADPTIAWYLDGKDPECRAIYSFRKETIIRLFCHMYIEAGYARD